MCISPIFLADMVHSSLHVCRYTGGSVWRIWGGGKTEYTSITTTTIRNNISSCCDGGVSLVQINPLLRSRESKGFMTGSGCDSLVGFNDHSRPLARCEVNRLCPMPPALQRCTLLSYDSLILDMSLTRPLVKYVCRRCISPLYLPEEILTAWSCNIMHSPGQSVPQVPNNYM